MSVSESNSHEGRKHYIMDVVCNYCGHDDVDEIYPAGKAQVARIVRCRSCNLMYANPRGQLVDVDNYKRFKPEGLLLGVADNVNHPYRWRLDKETLQIRDFDISRALINRLHPEQGRMLEVGSGLGYLLRSFRDEGWDVTAIDPWPELDAYTREVHGFPTAAQTLEQSALPSGHFDALIMLHVIEHVPDPMETLIEIYRVLRSGGHAIIETPRYDSFMYRLMGSRERSLRQDGHIYFFTTDTLIGMAQKAGFILKAKNYVGRSMTFDRFIWNAANVTKSDTIRHITRRASTFLRLDKVRFYLNLRDMIRIVIEKP